jgi:hypothetical protein
MPEISRTALEIAAMLEDGREIAFLDVHGGRWSNRRQVAREASIYAPASITRTLPRRGLSLSLRGRTTMDVCVRQCSGGNVDAPMTVRAVQACIRACCPYPLSQGGYCLAIQKHVRSAQGSMSLS